jgi:membrane-bound lytic murein transglycosylase
MKRHKEKKDEIIQLATKYASQVAQLEADGIKIKNKRFLIQLLEKSNGQVDVVKQFLAEREEQKTQVKSSTDEKVASSKKQHEISADDLDNLKRLRSAGIHGNPIKILTAFHECNESIEKTIARLEKEREQREEQSEKRVQVIIT